MKFKMIGGGFQHQKTISINNKTSKDFEWVKDNNCDKMVYIDQAIHYNLNRRPKNKVAWIFESEYIFSVDYLLSQSEKLLDSFELILTHNDKILALGKDKIKFVPANSFWILHPQIYPKNNLISMIASNKNITPGHKFKMKIIDKYRSQVDLYGRGFNNIQTKEEGLVNYMFSIVIENGKYDTYFTEKILDCFATGTIPIYWGTDRIGEHFDSNGIIKFDENFDLTKLNEDLYYSKLDSIKTNLELVNKYEILEDFIYKYISV
jgi:hypothetical protein